VVDEVPDWEELREAGRTLKASTMARLPELLEQLEERVSAAGGVVHWARDASEANRIVTDLVRATGADEVVKVKSMATQEIGLNEALEAGRYRGVRDRPRRAHRAARPRQAVAHPGPGDPPQPDRDPRHLPARDGRRPTGLTDDPPDLAEAARRHLRAKFLSAQVAVSGPTSPWQRPGRSRWSSRRATDACA
jgi:L-lactate dehydrogenase complex protein LldF